MTYFNELPEGHCIAGRYTICEKIGQGRSSAVYRATDSATRSDVALKVLDPLLAQDAVSLERFRREVEIIRSLQHPNVIKVYDFDRADELRFISMEFVKGGDLAERLRARGPMSLDDFIAMAGEILAAVDQCHRKMVLHRDIKPHNILLDRQGRARLVDFGVSKINTMSDLTKTGTAMGSPEYMAPELFRTTRSDPRSDIYSLGVVLFEMLAGHPPFMGDSLAVIMTQQLEGEPPRLCDGRREIPEWVEGIVLKCLRFDPDHRYQSVAEILTEFQRNERALARFEDPEAAVSCLRCGALQVPGLSFCQDCGRHAHENVEEGGHSLVAYKALDPKLLKETLGRLFPQHAIGDLASRLKRGPVVILGKVSESTARGLFNELAPLSCELNVVKRLPTQLRLPVRLAVLGLGIFGTLFAVGSELTSGFESGGMWSHVPLAVGCIGVSLFAIHRGYRSGTRPVIPIAGLESRAQSRPSQLSLRLAKAIPEIRVPHLRSVLGQMAASLLELEARRDNRSLLDIDELERLVLRCCATARRIEAFELYLDSQSLMEMKSKLDAVEIRLANSQDPSEMEGLIETKVALQSEMAEFQTTQDLHSRAFLTLLNTNGALEKLRNSVQSEEVAPDLDAEIEMLSASLDETEEAETQQSMNPTSLGETT